MVSPDLYFVFATAVVEYCLYECVTDGMTGAGAVSRRDVECVVSVEGVVWSVTTVADSMV